MTKDNDEFEPICQGSMMYNARDYMIVPIDTEKDRVMDLMAQSLKEAILLDDLSFDENAQYRAEQALAEYRKLKGDQ